MMAGYGLMIDGLTECYPDLAQGRLVAPFGPEFIHRFNHCHRLVWPAGRTLRGPLRKFQEWLVKEAEEYLADASRLLGTELDRLP
jgi:DNA-binding transcriptional LysR family regulator